MNPPSVSHNFHQSTSRTSTEGFGHLTSNYRLSMAEHCYRYNCSNPPPAKTDILKLPEPTPDGKIRTTDSLLFSVEFSTQFEIKQCGLHDNIPECKFTPAPTTPSLSSASASNKVEAGRFLAERKFASELLQWTKDPSIMRIFHTGTFGILN